MAKTNLSFKRIFLRNRFFLVDLKSSFLHIKFIKKKFNLRKHQRDWKRFKSLKVKIKIAFNIKGWNEITQFGNNGVNYKILKRWWQQWKIWFEACDMKLLWKSRKGSMYFPSVSSYHQIFYEYLVNLSKIRRRISILY